MVRAGYDFGLRHAQKPWAHKLLAVIAFAESSVFPLPPDALLIPMILAQRKRAFVLAGMTTLASVAGGIVAYGMGALAYEHIAKPIIDFYNYHETFHRFEDLYAAYGAWIVSIGGFTPIPYKVITLASGFVHLSFVIFVLFSGISRAARFFLIATLLYFYGEPIRSFIERHLGWITLLGTGILLLGFVLLAWL